MITVMVMERSGEEEEQEEKAKLDRIKDKQTSHRGTNTVNASTDLVLRLFCLKKRKVHSVLITCACINPLSRLCSWKSALLSRVFFHRVVF